MKEDWVLFLFQHLFHRMTFVLQASGALKRAAFSHFGFYLFCQIRCAPPIVYKLFYVFVATFIVSQTSAGHRCPQTVICKCTDIHMILFVCFFA